MVSGLKEIEFWEMSFSEIDRFIKAKREQDKIRASFDYILADLIGFSLARLQNSNNVMPALSEAYPNLFDRQAEEEEVQKRQDELSAVRFRMFADSFNKNFKKEVS